MKERKDRSKNLHGGRNFDYCSCGLINCDSAYEHNPSIATKKLRKRLSEDKCMACGEIECKCKSREC